MANHFMSVQRLVERSEGIDKMSTQEKAGYRATLTRLLKTVKEPELRQILTDLQAEVGPAVKKAKAKVTIEDVEREYHEFTGYDKGKRGAFKAKVTRMRMRAVKDDDAKTVKRLQKIESDITDLENKEVMASIREMLAKRKTK